MKGIFLFVCLLSVLFLVCLLFLFFLHKLPEANKNVKVTVSYTLIFHYGTYRGQALWCKHSYPLPSAVLNTYRYINIIFIYKKGETFCIGRQYFSFLFEKYAEVFSTYSSHAEIVFHGVFVCRDTKGTRQKRKGNKNGLHRSFLLKKKKLKLS